jgi:hypothetical protein
VCFPCHTRLHRRFKSPASWLAYKVHVRRGGFGSDLKIPKYSRELTRLARSIEAGHSVSLPVLRRSDPPWWESLTVNLDSLDGSFARPR